MDNNSSEALPEKVYPDESTLSKAYRRWLIAIGSWQQLSRQQLLSHWSGVGQDDFAG